METDPSIPPIPAPASGAMFVSTYWPTVTAAGSTGPDREVALDRLVRQYAPALRHYLRMKFGIDDPTAEDWVQSFLLDKVLKKNLLARARREKGKFRTFLATAIHHWAVDTLRRESARKRSPAGGHVTLEALAEGDPALASEKPDDEMFDQAFIRQVLATAVHRTKKHCLAHDHPEAWAVFYYRVLAPVLDIAKPKPYAEIVADLGLRSEAEGCNLLVTAKRILRRELETVVNDYVSHSFEAREELETLRRMLG